MKNKLKELFCNGTVITQELGKSNMITMRKTLPLNTFVNWI